MNMNTNVHAINIGAANIATRPQCLTIAIAILADKIQHVF
jgi:hypothetical protein